MTTKTLLALALAAGAVFSGSAPAAADGPDCRPVPAAEWRTMDDAIAAVKAKGYEIREAEIDDGCFEIKAIGKAGERVKFYLDPGTLEVVRTRDRS